MSYRALSTVLILMTSASLAVASGGGGHGEAAEGGEAKPAEKKEIKSAEDSYSVVSSRVQALEAKVKSGKEEIEKLIEEKHHTSNPQRIAEITRQMNTLHLDVQKNSKEYEQQRSLLKYRYPEKAAADKREYERIQIKSLEDMESEMSLGNSVNRTLVRIRQQYQTPEDETAAKKRKPSKEAAPSKQPSIIEPVILKK